MHLLLHGSGHAPWNKGASAFYKAIGLVREKLEGNIINILCLDFASFDDGLPIKVHWMFERLMQNVHAQGSASDFDPEFNAMIAQFHLPGLIKQIKTAHIIFASGGNGDQLDMMLRPIDYQLGSLLKGKVWMGGSAGSNTLSTYYYSNDNQKVMKGLGVAPIKTMCHYDSSKWEKLNQLMRIKPKLPTIPINNDDYVYVNINED